MKSLIPPEIRGKTLSNIIVVCIGIALAAVLLHIEQIWSGFMSVLNTLVPFLIGFAIAFLLLPIVNRVEGFLNRFLFRRRSHPKLSRFLATIAAYIVFLALVSAFFAILVPVTLFMMLFPLAPFLS